MDLTARLQTAMADLEYGQQAVGLRLYESAVDHWELTVEYEDGISRTVEIDADGPAAALVDWLQQHTPPQDYDGQPDPTE